jgi:hypothetical protein
LCFKASASGLVDAVDYFEVERIEGARAITHRAAPLLVAGGSANIQALSVTVACLYPGAGDIITLNRVRIKSEYLVSHRGTFPRKCSIKSRCGCITAPLLGQPYNASPQR